MLPTLYTFRRCPYAMRARMALGLAGIAYDTVEVSLRSKPPELLAISPKGTVPVMQLADGTVLEQSLDIMRWALAQNDPAGWLAAADEPLTAHWITLCDVTFKPLLDRYKYWNRHPELPMEAHRERAMDAFIRPLNAQLAMKAYVLASRASLADAVMFPFIRQFAAVDKVWFDAEPLPALQAWLASWLNSNLFQFVMQKSPPKESPPKESPL